MGLNPLVIGGHVTSAASENVRVRGGTAPEPKLTKTERNVLFSKDRDDVQMKLSVNVKTGEVKKRQKEATENKEIRSEIEAKAGKFGETVKMKKEKERVKQEMKQELVKKLERRKNVSEKVSLINENIKKNEINSILNKQTYNLTTRNSVQTTVTLKNGGGERVRTAVVSNGSVSHTQKNLAKPEMKIKWENNLNDKVNYRAGKLGHKPIENLNLKSKFEGKLKTK